MNGIEHHGHPVVLNFTASYYNYQTTYSTYIFVLHYDIGEVVAWFLLKRLLRVASLTLGWLARIVSDENWCPSASQSMSIWSKLVHVVGHFTWINPSRFQTFLPVLHMFYAVPPIALVEGTFLPR